MNLGLNPYWKQASFEKRYKKTYKQGWWDLNTPLKSKKLFQSGA